MESAPRYEILDTIAAGDFATVYRARDRALGREVAIKQIHQQFLSDPRQLERFWREAQLLASLQHPNILTIYDIDRSRGWLIVELMRGSLKRSAETGPMDLDYLRGTLLCALNALHFLHSNGVIHGDVKPGNLLVDPQGRVKLGDFGLARRASSEQGSLLKGTTKYMAPELASNQFGAVGPASDLYSLGFTAYELMCGPRFDSLFPGLATFGRDKQIAWLMWHAEADRHLPEIGRVLQGVPPDLVQVIQRLSTKDQSQRYQSAAEVMQDLRAGQLARSAVAPPPIPSAAPPVDRKKRLVRIAAIAAIACSALLSLAMLWPLPSASKPVKKNGPREGVVRSIDPDDRSLVFQETGETKGGAVLKFKPADKFFINEKEAKLRDLKVDDRISVATQREPGRIVTIVYAARPEPVQGRIKSVDADSREVVVARGGEEPLAVRVPEKVKILFNGSDALQGQPVQLADLRPGDRVVVQQIREDTGCVATELAAVREITLAGTIREVDEEKKQLTLSPGRGEKAEMITLPVAPQCEIKINDQNTMGERRIKISDLKPGVRATVTHDSQITRIDAYEVFGQAGVVRAVQAESLEVLEEGKQKPTTFLVDDGTKITLAGEAVALADLRAGDTVDIKHDSPGAEQPKAKSIAARRPAEKARFAIIVGVQNCDDSLLGQLENPAADAQEIRDTLVKRYRVPDNQAVLLLDPTQDMLKKGISELFERVEADSQVVVYFAGHAWRAEDGVYLAPKDFSHLRAAATGVSLQWIVDQYEECRAKEKFLLLDACNADRTADAKLEPSTEEMFRSLKGPSGQARLRTVTGIASCSAGERGYLLRDKNRGLFAQCLAEAFSGRADKNRDTKLDVRELFGYLSQSMPAAAKAAGHSQTPRLFLPDSRPPRLSADAKKAIRALASKISAGSVRDVKGLFDDAQKLAGTEVEPKVLYGLALLKSPKQRAEAIVYFQTLKTEQADLLPVLQAVAWLAFDKRAFAPGMHELTELVAKVPKSKGEPYPPSSARIFRWAGQIREFASAVLDPRAMPEDLVRKLDAAVASAGEEAGKIYEQGREQTRATVRDFDQKIDTAGDDATKSKLRIDRKQFIHYAVLPLDALIDEVLAGLDK
ncbi:MAG: protein kinase domain-containing protein [Thermoguttaceae bacterium]